MNRRSIILGIVILLFFAMIVGILFSRLNPIRDKENALSPQAQTQRLTSIFLLRKINQLRDQAVYLQHKEEGGKLLELAGRGAVNTSQEEYESTGTGEVVE